jgi:hypothetical protein
LGNGQVRETTWKKWWTGTGLRVAPGAATEIVIDAPIDIAFAPA